VTVSQLNFTKTGVLSDNSIAGAYLTQNGQVVAQYNSINSGVISFSGLNLSIGAGQTQEFTLAIDVSGGLSAGNTTGFSLPSASDVTAWTGSNTAVTPSGNFPLNGNTFTVTSVSNPSLATLGITSSSVGNVVTAGTQGNLVGAWNFSVGNSPVWLNSINFHVIGSANVANIQNIKLMVNGTQVGATLSSVSSNGTAYLNLTSAPAKLNTGSNNIQVFADIMGSPSFYFQFEILNGFDVLAVDSQYNVPVTITNTSGIGSQIQIQTGQTTMTQDTNTPTGSIAKGTSQVTLAKFDIYASGEPVKIKFIGFQLAFQFPTATGTSQYAYPLASQVKNVSLVDDAGGQVGSTINTPPSGSSCDVTGNQFTGNGNASLTATEVGTSTVYNDPTSGTYVDCFGSSGSPINYQIPANTTRVLSLKADVQTSPSFSTVVASLLAETANNLQGVISSMPGNTGGATGSSLSLANSSLTVSKNNALGNQSVSAGVTNQKIGSYTFQAASAEGVNVNNVSISTAGNNPNGSTFQNLHLMVNGAQFGSTQGTVASGSTYTFSGTPFLVPAGSSVNVDVYADTLSTDPSGTITQATTLTGCSATGAISYSSVSCNNTAGQNLSFGGNPTITVSADSTEPPAAQIVMGSTGNTLGIYRFTETSNIENVKVTDLQVVDTVSSTNISTGVKAAFSNLQLWNGSTLLGTAGSPVVDAAGTGYIYAFHFGTPIIVPQANSVSVTLKGDAATYSSQGATDNSTSSFQIATTTDSFNSSSSQTVVALGQTSNKPTGVTISSANGNVNTVLRSTLTVAVAPLGQTQNRSKGNPDDFGTVTFTANAAGPVALNKLTVTFSGAATSSFFTNANISLIDQNGNVVNSTNYPGSNEVASSTLSNATWSFPAAQSGFQISAGGSYTFKLRLNTVAIGPPSGQQSETLVANIQNSTDISYTDGLDASSTSGLALPASVVPLTINSVSYAPGN
jgi:hypothetical protein